MRKNEKGDSVLEFFIGFGGIVIFLILILSFYDRAVYNNKRAQLKKQFNIDLTVNSDFSNQKIAILRPTIERRLNELRANYDSAASIFGKDQTKPFNTDEAYKMLVIAENNLKEACESAKYFKLVSEDCEPCKAVK